MRLRITIFSFNMAEIRKELLEEDIPSERQFAVSKEEIINNSDGTADINLVPDPQLRDFDFKEQDIVEVFALRAPGEPPTTGHKAKVLKVNGPHSWKVRFFD